MASSPYEATGNGPGIPTLGAARQLGQLLAPATIEAVTAVDLEPYYLIPGGGGAGPTNSFGGHAAFWSGVRIRVASETGPLEVPIALAAGGADVVTSLMADVDRSAFDALVDSCAVVLVAQQPNEPLGTAESLTLVAVASAPTERPVIFASRFKSLRTVPASLEAMATAP